MLHYTEEQIQQIGSLLDSLEIKGIENIKRIVGIINILNNPSKDEEVSE
jgi:hypothetical protein